MEPTKPKCGHKTLKSDCTDCEKFKRKWYQKISQADEEWRDIEYGLENPERLYDPPANSESEPLASDYYDRVMAVFHSWVEQGRSKRDCLIAELMGRQEPGKRSQREISSLLRSKRIKPNSRFTVRQTLLEIHALATKKAHLHLIVEQASPALYPLDSKPHKDEADGQTAQRPTKAQKCA